MVKGNSALIQSLKIVLISTGALFIAGILLSLFSGAAPEFWSSLGAWLRPPYLYVIVNGIIITIAASSRLHHAALPEDVPHLPPKHTPSVPADELYQYDNVSDADSIYGGVPVKDLDVEMVKSVVTEVKTAPPVTEFQVPETALNGHETSTWTVPPPLIRQNPVDVSPELFSERPPVSSRFAHHRRSAKANPSEGGRALRRVSKPKRHETLENTWKAITEGRAMPLTRHLKVSDTWQNQSRQINNNPVKKSETFNDLTNHNPPPVVASSRLLKRERLLSQDELNRRVEAFITKFNEDMRLQRQQSIEQFMDKISRI